MSDPYECRYECKHADYCHHTEEYYCDIDNEPIFMAHSRYWDAEIGECSKKEPKD